MKTPLIFALLTLGCLLTAPHASATPPASDASTPSPAAQTQITNSAAPQATASTPPAAPGALAHTNDLGFSYSLPVDWEVVDAKPILPVVQQNVEDKATSNDEKKGASCVQIALLARHGSPTSVIEAITLPFDCLGQTYTDKDLSGFALGVTEGLKKYFSFIDPVYDAYKLGTHSLWIARTPGSFINHPEVKRNLEVACSILKKGAVCWVAIAADEDAMQTFEHGAVTLEGESENDLVPATVLQKKP